MTPKDFNDPICVEHTKKLDTILMLLQGSQDMPGLIGNQRKVMNDLYGNGKWGIKTKLEMMWRLHVWLLCSGSAVLGYIAREVFEKGRHP